MDVAPDAGAQGDALPETVNVLIIGCGPTGLTLAAQLSAFPGIETRVVERKDGLLKLGQADGIACRTIEMFEAFGFADRIAREVYWVNETTFWKPDETTCEIIVRHGRVQDVEDGLSEFPHVILNQARVHDCYLDFMRKSPRRLEPDYERRFLDLEIDEHTGTEYPVTVRLERADGTHAGEVETVRAKYVVGCDGARSGVRQVLGRTLVGDSANQAWGVMDVLDVTDFPDIRLKSAIHSANEGNVLIIPREGGYLVRLYVEMDKLAEDERVVSRNITVDHLIAAAQRILAPHTLEVKEVAWWSVYEIGRRLTDSFDDVPEAEAAHRTHRVFIAGDVCHTHSPKAGQGMNVSMQDTFNLGWKFAHVLTGRAAPELLSTYSAERQSVAQELIDFDREWSKMFSAAPRKEGDVDGEGVDPQVFQDYFLKFGGFTAGTATRYRPSVLTGEANHQDLATGFPIGMRFHSAPVIRLADAKPLHLGHVAEVDGCWRIYTFADGDNGAVGPKLAELCVFLEGASASPVKRVTPEGADRDSVIDVRAVFQPGHRELALEEMSAFLLPKKGRYALTD